MADPSGGSGRRVADYDRVVFNASFLSSHQQPFLQTLDAAHAAGVSTNLPSQYGGTFPIPLLSTLRGDPASATWDFVSVGVDYVPTAQHPIFAGFPVGEPIELLTSTLSNSNQQYGAYSGWSGMTIGRLQSRVEGASLGDAVGYQFSSPASVDVLLGGLAASIYGWPDERWTDNARKIYLNAVAWAIDARQAELSGVVTGAGSPVAGAAVTAVEAGAVAVTGADGTYALGLPGGPGPTLSP
ncbi:MAG TPA: carboxypeptidase-like regulatory domain-containing protein [Jiangellaceae bacterium]|nr:carboxypeptidase-like regulatory domain-containing protein [Jiangellaceae bacterium]